MTNYKIEMPRKTFNGLCAYLQQWGRIYAIPEAVVLKGALRCSRNEPGSVGAVDVGTDANMVAFHFNRACCALGRSKVTKNAAVLDLRDLSDSDLDGLQCAAMLAKLKPQQACVMDRIAKEVDSFIALPSMVRIAVAMDG